MKLEYFTRTFFTLGIIFWIWNDLHSPALTLSFAFITIAHEMTAYSLREHRKKIEEIERRL